MQEVRVRFLFALGGAIFAVIVGLLVVAMVSSTEDDPPGNETAVGPTPLGTAPPAATSPRPGEAATVEPTLEYLVRQGCDQWPDEVIPIVVEHQLSVPAAICLRTVVNPDTCRGARACYDAETRTIWRLTRESAEQLPNSPLISYTDQFVLLHELCHAHQHWQIIREQVQTDLRTPLEAWSLTQEGRAYLALSSSLPRGFVVIPEGPLESFANACAAYLLPSEGHRRVWVDPHPALMNFLQTWLTR